MEDLRRRLQEAEDTINAIRDGHVEAVVNAPDGEQIYTLRTVDQPYRLMVEQMREGALTLSADGTILYCNQRFAELMARPAERIAGQALAEFLHADDLPTMQRVLNSESCRAEVQLRTAGGAVNPAQLSSITLNIDGVRTVAVVVTDLTHERTERGLRESNRLKDEFLATLSHELRTPLNVILGWTRMLLNDHLNEQARQHALELIDRNAQAQAQLVNDLVDMSRMTTGKLQVELESLPVVPVLEAALESVRPAAQAKDLSIHTEWRVQDANVLADATRLQQVLWNLLSNAVKFTPEGGRIEVRAERVDGHVEVSVIDTGIGIASDDHDAVFEEFRQVGTASKKVEGTGLGLAISRKFIELHGGSIWVDSQVGKGSTFAFTLPLTIDKSYEDPPAHAAANRSS
jgi:PAS domain S-box-containing protein